MKKQIQSLLKSLEKNRTKYWNITPEVGKFLNLLIKTRKYTSVLEIGTSNGYSAIWLGEALFSTNGHLWTMESHKKERFRLAMQNIKRSGLNSITQILGHAPEDLPTTPKYFDLAFFDATKHEHLSYFKALKSRIKKGGVIVTDNAISHKADLKIYSKTLQKTKGWHSETLSLGTGLMVSVRK